MRLAARSALLLSLAAASPAAIAQGPFSLSNYSLTGTHGLPAGPAAEASAITRNWNTGTFFVLGDEGDAIVEVDALGKQVSTMSLTGFDDTEGLTYIGNNQFVLVEERLQDAYLLTYAANGSVDRASLKFASIGPTIGNIGLEGLSFNPLTGDFVVVKEKDPQAVYNVKLDFQAGTAQVSDLFAPSLGVLDLSDVQHLATAPIFVGTEDQDNLLIFSQESSRILEVSPTGQILSSFDFSKYTSSAEGITIGPDGTIYIVDESPTMYVLTVPTPGAGMLACAGLAMLARRKRR